MSAPLGKHRSLIILLVTMMLLLGVGVTYAASPNAYVVYFNQQADTVGARVYFEDATESFTVVQLASQMAANGGSLDWGSNLTVTDGDGNLKYVTLSLSKYMNYFVRITDETFSETTEVRLFPVDSTTAYGTDREFNDYAHGNFQPGTSMCAGCHVTHSALKEQLLKSASYYELCMLCHSNANTQSKYDVERGRVTVAGAATVPSLAGPFVTGAVSLHNSDDTGGATPLDVPGSDPAKKLSLTCVSCHRGHGGTDDNYRLLKKTIYADDGRTLVANAIDYEAYAITDSDVSGEELYMVKGNSELCSACHLDYDDGNAWNPGGIYAADVDPGPGKARYRHPVSVASTVYSVYGSDGLRNPAYLPSVGDNLPLQYNSAEQKGGITDKRTAVVCSTCHYAHGSTKTFMVQESVYDNKYMLRLNNYGVCQSCHKK